MEIKEIKKELKKRKITYIQLSNMSSIPLQTIQKIFSGQTANPRMNTVKAIEKALEISNCDLSKNMELKEQRLFNTFNELTPHMQDYFIEIMEKFVIQEQNKKQ